MFTEEQKKLLDKLFKVDDILDKSKSYLGRTSNNVFNIRAINKNFHKTAEEKTNELKEVENNIVRIVEEKTKGFPWLADAIAQYYELEDLKLSNYLKHKKHPAIKSAKKISEIAREKRIIEKQFRITRNLIKYYESLFPWLPEFIGEDIDDLIEQVANKEKEEIGEDPVSFYLTQGEYNQLSTTVRNQLALDRYKKKKKSPWELGRDYERYIGYLYEKDGYNTYYQGIEKGLEDLGRDLIAKRKNEVKVIQCKYWAKHKTIHEKHICQLFGTTLKYWVEEKKLNLSNKPEFLIKLGKRNELMGVFITSTGLSDVAKEFANELGIEVKENFPLEDYPAIKCNISMRTGEKIYHLPIDQQYDKTIIEEERNECYVETVAEAEKLSFRRAWRWKGNKDNFT